MSRYRTIDGDTVDLIAWRVYGGAAGVVEQILALNPGLADAGPVLSAGLIIELPPAPLAAATPERTPRLWD
jgi:phage tail protein X